MVLTSFVVQNRRYHHMKRCPQCDTMKPVEDFALARKRHDGRQSTCRVCKRARDKQYYVENHAARRRSLNANTNRRRQVLRDIIMEHLLQNPCVDCGESDPIVLDFDHVKDGSRNAKSTEVSMMLNGIRPVDVLKEEIAKCEIRCANCHRRKTAKEENWWRHSQLV